jgi:hypothetical protein
LRNPSDTLTVVYLSEMLRLVDVKIAIPKDRIT